MLQIVHIRSYFSQICVSFFIYILITSCNSSKNIDYNPTYFKSGPDSVIAVQKERFIRPSDQLSIQVYSKTPNQEQAAVFNLFSSSGSTSLRDVSSSSLGTSGMPAAAASSSSGLQGYRVNESGNIDMPVIGTITTTGFTIYQLQDYIAKKIANYVKEPVVIVHYQQFEVNVLGEVKVPGVKKFTTDKVTILDALGASGDLTDFGRRNDITVIRNEDGKEVFYHLDLGDRNIFKSPVYLLQPKDVVYVGPTINKLQTLNISPNAQKNTTLIFGIFGLTLSIATLIVSLSYHK